VLSDDAIERYARQIVLPEIGVSGQGRLLASTVLVVGHPRGVRQATLYLRAAGARVTLSASVPEPDVVVVADASTLDASLHEKLVTGAGPLCWYRCEGAAFTTGIHPASALPAPRITARETPDALHDAAACDVAALACALIVGMSPDPAPVPIAV